MRPRKSGKAKFCNPSPPYVVPMKEKSTMLSRIDSSEPSQRAQFAGTKSPAKSRISATYPSMGHPLSQSTCISARPTSRDRRRYGRHVELLVRRPGQVEGRPQAQVIEAHLDLV